jgi:hypothetical protein
VRGLPSKNERKWPIRPFWIASRPLNSCDQEYCPVTIQTASPARLSANVVPLRLAESVSACWTSFLFAAALMAAFSVDLTVQTHRAMRIILPIDCEYDIYSPDEFEFA